MSKRKSKALVRQRRKWGLQCLVCKKRMFSFFRHDYKVCGCPNSCMVDGGDDYLRCGAADLGLIRSIYWSKQDGEYPKFKPVKDRFPY